MLNRLMAFSLYPESPDTKIAKMTTSNEYTQCLNLARALDLITSSRTVGGVLYVYNAAGHAKSWDSFMTEFPLERLQAMVKNRK